MEQRVALSVTIEFDYSHDTSGFFTANPVTQTLLQQAGQLLGGQLNNTLAAITPDPGAGDTCGLLVPFTGNIDNPTLAANTILVEVVASAQDPGSFAAAAGPSSFYVTGSSDWANTVATRGGNARDAGLWGGGIEFNTNSGWFTLDSSGQMVFDQKNYLGITIHELGHILGLGSTQAWTSLVDTANTTFTGPHAKAYYGGPVPLDPGNGEFSGDNHWAKTVLSHGQVPVMIPFYQGTQRFTSLDWAGLDDLGWSTDHLAVTTQPPPTVIAGSGFGLAVTAEDPNGSVDTLDNGPVTISLANNPGGATLGGTLTANAVNGVAVFSGLTLNETGSDFTIQASSSGLPSATTSGLSVTPPGAAAELAVTTEPPFRVVAGSAFGLTVAVEVVSGQVNTSFNGQVTLSLAGNPGGTTLHGATTVNAVAGVAVFSGLTLDKAESGYTITATATGYIASTSTAIVVTHAQASQLVVTAPPPSSVQNSQGFTVTIEAEDPYGNLDPDFAGTLSMSLISSGGVISWGGHNIARAGSGVANAFFSWGMPGSGYALKFACANDGLSGLTVTTSPFDVTPATRPGSGGPGGPPKPKPTTIIGEQILTAGKGKHKRFAGFELIFSEPLDLSRATNTLNYRVTQTIKRGHKVVIQSVKFTALYIPESHSVSLIVTGKPPFSKGGQIVVIATPPGGITDSSGGYLEGNTTLVILPKARNVIA